MNKIQWIFFRLKAMSLFEIGYRVKEKIKKKKYKKKYIKKQTIANINKINICNFDQIDITIQELFNVKFLENVSFNSLMNIYEHSIDLNHRINWHITNHDKQWPKDKSCFDITFKEKNNLEEIRYTWEINRHLFFPQIALQYVCNNNEKMYSLLKKHFYDWVEENPFLYGVNWMSPMEIAIRSYQWLITYSIIKDKAEEKFKKDILKAIINSTEYVSNNFSKYSSANNHLIVEAAIVSIIGYCIQPIHNQNWFNIGNDILKKQIPLQVHEDGVNKEQATHYHAFVLDMMLQYNIFLKKIGYAPLHEELIFKMAEFIGYIYNNGDIVEFGDSDDAKILDFDGKRKNYYTFVLQLASIYYKKQLIETNNLYSEVKFLIGNLFVKNKNEICEYKYLNIKVYPKGGYCVLNNKKDFLLFDVGELGFGSIAAHGHADALSIVYHNNNNPIFIDSGTYIYNVEHMWRNYFRETENHNTLSVEGKSQSKIEGPFLWSKKAKVSLSDYGENKNLVYFKAQHEGYFPGIHQRAITHLKSENIIIIEDSFNEKGMLNYVIDKNVQVNKVNDNLIKLNKIYFYSSNKIEIVEKYISKSFLIKEKTKGLKILNDFRINKTNYCLISTKPIEFKDNKIILNKEIYTYINYKDIRSESIENC